MQKIDKNVEFQRMPINGLSFRTKRLENKVKLHNLRSAFELYYFVVYGDFDEFKSNFTPMDILDIERAVEKLGENYLFSEEMINHLNTNCSDRDINLYADWHSGMTYKALGEKYDMTADRASQIVRSIDRKLVLFNAVSGDSIYKLNLSTRSYNALSRGNIHKIDELVEAFKKGTLFKIRNFGTVSLIEIAEKLDEYKGTNYREVIRGREEELIYEGKTKCKDIPIRETLSESDKNKIQELKLFKFYKLDDGRPDDGFSDVVLVHINMEENQLYFLAVTDFRSFDSLEAILVTTNNSYEYPVYNVEGKYYSPIVSMITIDFDDYLSGNIKVLEYKLEGDR